MSTSLITPTEQTNTVSTPTEFSGSRIHFDSPKHVVKEATTIECSFNVMPDRPVKETLHVKEYRIWDNYAEAIFDRKYFSSMERSPDHLIFLSALIHSQKMIYAYLCHEWNLPYDPNGSEKLKVWPTDVRTFMPGMITDTSDIIHKMWVKSLVELPNRPGTFTMNCEHSFNDLLTISGFARIYKL